MGSLTRLALPVSIYSFFSHFEVNHGLAARRNVPAAAIAMSGLAFTGSGPESGTRAPLSGPALSVDVKEDTAATGCRGVRIRQGREMRRFADATPADLRRCLAVEGMDRGKLLHSAASPVFPDDETASGVRAIFATAVDPNVSPNGGQSTPPAFRARAGWIPGHSKPLSPARAPEADGAVARALPAAGAEPDALKTSGARTGTSKPLRPLPRAASRNRTIPTRVHGDSWGQNWRVLHAPVGSGRPTRTIAALFEYEADPTKTVAPGQDRTALHVSAFMARPDVIHLQPDHDADPHAGTTYRKWSAFHALAEGAVGPGAAESGKLLLDAGIDPKTRDRKGRTAWDLVRARLAPERLEASPPETRQVLARLQTATRGW